MWMAGPARGDHRDLHRLGDGPRQGEVIAAARPVGIDAGEQDLAAAALLRRLCPLDRVKPGRLPSAMRVDLPAVIGLALGVDGDDDALRSELPRTLGDQLRALHGGRLDRDFVGTGAEQGADLVDLANAAADGEWDEDGASRSFDNVDQGGALLWGGLDVEEDELIRALLRV